MKDTYYFSHDYNARNDPKIQKVLMKLGQAGKGLYWDVIEMLYEEGGYLMLSECDAYAFALRSDSECINSLINDFDLFQKDSEKFWSDSVLRRLNKRKEKSDKAAQSAQKRWNNANAPKPYANALRPECEGNALKERKGKESKEDNILTEVPAGAKAPNKYDAFLKLFNELTKRQFRSLDDKCKRQFDKLQKAGYKYPDFKTAITNGFEDSRRWPEPASFTPEYLTRESLFVKYLNWGSGKVTTQQSMNPEGPMTREKYIEMFFGTEKEKAA